MIARWKNSRTLYLVGCGENIDKGTLTGELSPLTHTWGKEGGSGGGGNLDRKSIPLPPNMGGKEEVTEEKKHI